MTSFTIHHRVDTFDEFVGLTYSGCRLSGAPPTVDVIGSGSTAARLSVTFKDEGDGVAFVHLTAPSGSLPDGTNTFHLVIRGGQVSTSVISVSIAHQYRSWLLAMLFAIAGWLVGLIISAAHGGSVDPGGNPRLAAIVRQLKTRWWAIVPTIGAAYVAYIAAYENDSTFSSGLVSLLGLATKIGAATAGALVLTSTAGASAQSITRALRGTAQGGNQVTK